MSDLERRLRVLEQLQGDVAEPILVQIILASGPTDAQLAEAAAARKAGKPIAQIIEKDMSGPHPDPNK